MPGEAGAADILPSDPEERKPDFSVDPVPRLRAGGRPERRPWLPVSWRVLRAPAAGGARDQTGCAKDKEGAAAGSATIGSMRTPPHPITISQA